MYQFQSQHRLNQHIYTMVDLLPFRLLHDDELHLEELPLCRLDLVHQRHLLMEHSQHELCNLLILKLLLMLLQDLLLNQKQGE